MQTNIDRVNHAQKMSIIDRIESLEQQEKVAAYANLINDKKRRMQSNSDTEVLPSKRENSVAITDDRASTLL